MSHNASKQQVRSANTATTPFETREKLFSASIMSKRAVKMDVQSARSVVLWFARDLAYRYVSEDDNVLVFKRGSWLDAMTVPFPHKLPSRFTVKLVPLKDERTGIEAQMQIRAPSIMLSYRDICYWQTELDEFWRSLHNNPADARKLRQLSTRTLVDTAIVSTLAIIAGFLLLNLYIPVPIPVFVPTPETLDLWPLTRYIIVAIGVGTLLYILVEQFRRVFKV